MNNLNTPQPYYDPNTELDPDMIEWATTPPVPYTHNRSWATIIHDMTLNVWEAYNGLAYTRRFILTLFLIYTLSNIPLIGPWLGLALIALSFWAYDEDDEDDEDV